MATVVQLVRVHMCRDSESWIQSQARRIYLEVEFYATVIDVTSVHGRDTTGSAIMLVS